MRGLGERWREWRAAREEYRASQEEMQFHVEQETAHNVRNGMSPAAARRAARLAFGGVERFAEAAHDQRPGTRWSEFRMSWLDWKLGARMLLKYPAVSLISGITLAAAIGLGAGWFEMTRMLFDPELPLEDGDRIVRIEHWDPVTLKPEQRTLHEFVQWRSQLTTIEGLGAHRTVERNLVVPGAPPQVVRVAEISPSAFDVTRVPPLLGRPLIGADEEQGSAAVVVIGYDAWQRHFAGDRTVVGSEVQLGGTYATVVGVMPEGYRFPSVHEFWLPLRPALVAPLEGEAIEVFGRLRQGVTPEAAAAELTAWNARMAQRAPAPGRLRVRVLPFAASNEPGLRREALFINLAAWLILAAACANVATLMFARTALREGEIVVRNALGASRARVMGQLFTEALVLTCGAAVVGLLGARLVIGYVIDLSITRGRPVPFWWDADIEPLTVLYTAGLAIAGAGMVGLLPAIRATGRHVRAGLAQFGSGGTSMHFGGAWSILIVLQVAFSVVCLPFGIAAVVEAYRESRLRAAFPADAFLTFRPVLDREGAAGPSGDGSTAPEARLNALVAELSTRLVAEPEVDAVTITSSLPGTYHPLLRIEAQRGAEPPYIVDANEEGDRVRTGAVGPGFFETFAVPVKAGREFGQGDVGAAAPAAVVNETLARNLGGNPIGVRVRVAASGEASPGPWLEVVGVTGNFGLTPTRGGEGDYLYTAAAPAAAGTVVVRVRGDPAGFGRRLRDLALQVDPTLRLHDVLPLREVILREDRSMIQATLAGTGVVLLALVLSAASLHALMSVAVALRTREIGIRLAVGATPRAVLSALFRRAATQVGIGILAGNLGVALLLHVVTDEVQALAVLGPMAAASAVMLLVGVASCLAPARRALRIQPTTALRQAD